ncbi:hypothetical protein Bpfe_011931, partial [Biomphalaria pfeifferi]
MVLEISYYVYDDVDTEQNFRANDVGNEHNLECSLKEVNRLSQLNCTPREENQIVLEIFNVSFQTFQITFGPCS